jgi:hypothetical protein
VSKKAIRLVAQVTCAVAVALVATSLGGGEAMAQKKVKSIKTEAKFVSYDAATKTIVVQVMKAGQKPSDAALKLKNGNKDIPDGKTINIYWVPDESKPDTRFARKIDMILSDEELEARDQERMEAEKAAGRVAEGDS